MLKDHADDAERHLEFSMEELRQMLPRENTMNPGFREAAEAFFAIADRLLGVVREFEPQIPPIYMAVDTAFGSDSD